MRFFLVSFFLISTVAISGQGNADSIAIKNHVLKLTGTSGFRNHNNLLALNEAADYIFNQFSLFSDSVFFQKFSVNGKEYKNVICSFGPSDAPLIVVGAHYDVCGNQMGADDNASGVSALLELSRLFKGIDLNYRIEIVAYTLEESYYFETENMGSYIHAKALSERNASVYGMICLDLIGYYNYTKGSQEYPLPLMSLFYGKRGDYIVAVNKFVKGRFAGKFSRVFKHTSEIRAKKFSGPESLSAIGLSDHLNYWKFGYSATFITNTAFYRNKNYHTPKDVPDILNYGNIAKVTDAVFYSILKMNK